MELLYCPNGMQNGFTNPFAKKFSETSLEKAFQSGADGRNDLVGNGDEGNKRRDVIVRGVLTVTVINAEDLAPADLIGGKADPYVVLTLKKTESKNKTRVSLLLFIRVFGENFNQKKSSAPPPPTTNLKFEKVCRISLLS